jgi:putative SOS response-associated peptidase YedK
MSSGGQFVVSPDSETTNDIFAFLTINPNAEVSAIHPKAMPVILRTVEEMDAWMSKPAAEALNLQRPLPDGCCGSWHRGRRRIPKQGPQCLQASFSERPATI